MASGVWNDPYWMGRHLVKVTERCWMQVTHNRSLWKALRVPYVGQSTSIGCDDDDNDEVLNGAPRNFKQYFINIQAKTICVIYLTYM